MEGEGSLSHKKKRFDRDFKIQAVKMVTEGAHKALKVASLPAMILRHYWLSMSLSAA